jgi:hypothetical protein
VVLPLPASAAETSLNGKVVNVTSIETGVLIQFENGAVLLWLDDY